MRLALPLALAALVAAGSRPAAARELHGVPLPAGTRALDDGSQESGLGFRKTVDFYERFLKRTGLAHQQLPATRHRGVVVVRFLARAPAPWRAIHVFWTHGHTRIYVVPASPLTPPTDPGKDHGP